MMTVGNIRLQDIKITKDPIVYYWWFKTDCFKQLLSLLNEEIDYKKIVIKEINNKHYGLLYIGKGKNGHDRLIKYHIHDSQNFHESGVENRRLSSLRKTLCGLLQLPMSTSKGEINDFMDKNCIVEFDICSLQELNKLELDKITNNYLPLNYHHTTKYLTGRHRAILTECKKSMRQ